MGVVWRTLLMVLVRLSLQPLLHCRSYPLQPVGWRRAAVRGYSSLSREREFVPLPPSPSPSMPTSATIQLRVLQFNMLADGLSGLQGDLGGFSRVQRQEIAWSARSALLLEEVTRYAPDIIALQECDHYDDFFLPELRKLGYEGLFVPKPASLCRQVSERSDGCALFFRTRLFKLVASSSFSYASPSNPPSKALNQVALLAVLQPVAPYALSPIIVATTHLKASKTLEGERIRCSEISQLLDALEQCASSLSAPAAVILAADLNASPQHQAARLGYDALVLPCVQSSALRLRSAYNDDLPSPAQEVWTTWKIRRRGNKDQEVRHCIDYILYSRDLLRAVQVLGLPSDDAVGPRRLPSAIYPSDHLSLVADLQLCSPSSTQLP